LKEESEMKRKTKVVVEKDGILHVIPQKPIKEMRGFAKGIDTTNLRDEEDRF